MDSIRVFVVSNNSLFSCGLKSLLAPESQVEIIGEETNVDRAIQQIETLKPDVVIWGGSGLEESSVPEEISLLKADPSTKVIGLNLQSNDLFVYRAIHRVVTDVKDLVEAIELDFYSNGSFDAFPKIGGEQK